MFFRVTVSLVLSSMLFAAGGAAQQSSVTLGDDAKSFRIAAGSSFSAAGKAAEPLPVRSAAVRAVTRDLSEALEIVKHNAAQAEHLENEALLSSAINRMLNELDPHSTYYTRKEFRDLNDENRGRYFGIGITLSNFTRDGQTGCYIISVGRGTPAERAEFRFGDRITSIDGKDIAGLEPPAVRDLIRGPEGSTVTISVTRSGHSGLRNVTSKRTKLLETSIPSAFIFEDRTGYIALTEGFNYSTADEFFSAFQTLRAGGMTSLLIDLRGNGGGIMDQAIRIAERFLPAGRLIVSQRGRNSSEDRVWRSNSLKPETLPLVVLVDENTASASEIFAGAMQDNDRAVIVGSRTFGKGLIQDVISLEDGSGLVLTSERYYTPSGRSIQREYSDGHLYDYFRQLERGTLIGKAQFAARTAGGRTVYGGDGIQPDVVVPTKAWTAKDLADYEAAFFEAHESSLDNSATQNIHVRWFQAVAKGDSNLAARVLLETDPQFKAALEAAKNSPLAK